MIYDRDLRRQRWCIWAFILANAGGVAGSAARHEWPQALAYAIWTLSCTVWLRLTRSQQITRDMGRVIESGLRQEIERRER